MLVTFVAFWGWRKFVPPTIRQRLDDGNQLLAEGEDCGTESFFGTNDKTCQESLRSAAVAYRSVIRMQPKSTEAYMGLAIVSFDDDNLANSLANWRKAVQLEPRNAYAHYWMGVTLDHLGQHAAANGEYRIAHGLSPHDNSYTSAYPPGARKFENDD